VICDPSEGTSARGMYVEIAIPTLNSRCLIWVICGQKRSIDTADICLGFHVIVGGLKGCNLCGPVERETGAVVFSAGRSFAPVVSGLTGLVSRFTIAKCSYRSNLLSILST